jgi:predicted DNA-binding WGR domain protein
MSAIQVIEEWAGHFREPVVNSDKVWAAAYTSSGHYLAVWGRRSTKYQSQSKQLGTSAQAARLFWSKRDEKRAKGYQVVAFGDALHGAIPSFATVGVVGVASAARITLAGVLAELDQVPANMRRAGPRLPDVVLAFMQTRLKAELLIESGGLPEPERGACVAALAEARMAVSLALVA